jgi:hypothetical protein
VRKSLGVIACVIGVLVAGCGSSGSSDQAAQRGMIEQIKDQVQRIEQHVAHHRDGMVRAKMVPGLSYTSSTVQWPQNGGWLAETRGEKTQLFVLAGGDHRSRVLGDPDHPRDGLIQIMRAGGIGNSSYNERNEFVVVHETGAITITEAPVGKGLPASVLHGDVGFTSQSGTAGTLHLSDDTVTLDP